MKKANLKECFKYFCCKTRFVHNKIVNYDKKKAKLYRKRNTFHQIQIVKVIKH